MGEFFDFFDDNVVQGKSFNTTGVCNRNKHYMVNINQKLKEIVKLVQNDKYFVINRPRQFGKTTTLNELQKILKTRYKVIKLDFEGIGTIFESEKEFCNYFSKIINTMLNINVSIVFKFVDLADFIRQITNNSDVILIIDEVDKASNNKLFLEFLGMLRLLYLSKAVGNSTTFKSVILAGVYDIKNLKLKFRDDTNIRYNSPWNIADEFDVDLSFNEAEIGTMLNEYANENKLNLNIELLSEDIYIFTCGYPFLVSRVCQIIDKDIFKDKKTIWDKQDIKSAVKIIINEKNILFDDLIKNLENNKSLYDCIYNILVLNINQMFNINNPIVERGHMFGYLSADKDNNVVVSNQILKEVIYNYMISKTNTLNMSSYNFKDNFISSDNGLDML